MNLFYLYQVSCSWASGGHLPASCGRLARPAATRRPRPGSCCSSDCRAAVAGGSDGATCPELPSSGIRTRSPSQKVTTSQFLNLCSLELLQLKWNESELRTDHFVGMCNNRLSDLVLAWLPGDNSSIALRARRKAQQVICSKAGILSKFRNGKMCL